MGMYEFKESDAYAFARMVGTRRNRTTESCFLRLVRIAVHVPRKTMFVHSP